MKMDEETDYIIPHLRAYGNTIITNRDLKKVGGSEMFLKILKAKGFDCELVEPFDNYECKQKGGKVYAHKIVKVRR